MSKAAFIDSDMPKEVVVGKGPCDARDFQSLGKWNGGRMVWRKQGGREHEADSA